MKTVDFEDKEYNQIYNFVCKCFNPKYINADVKSYFIEVNTSRIYFRMQFSGNETKIYFFQVPYILTSKEDYYNYRIKNGFRVFTVEDEIKYIKYKHEEDILICSIEG